MSMFLQVLDAVGRGQTIVSAFQEAVPEDVRGTMAAAVSGAVQARGISFNLVGFGSSMPPPSLPAGLTEKIQEKLAAVAGGKKDAASGPSLFLSSNDTHGTPLTGSVEHDKPNQGSSDPEKGSRKGTENRGSDDPTSNGTGKSKAEENGSVMAGSSDSKKAIPGKPEDVEVRANEGESSKQVFSEGDQGCCQLAISLFMSECVLLVEIDIARVCGFCDCW